MYPRNAASPPRIAIGPVVQISDGAVQTSGVTVSYLKEGGSETGSGGTVAYSTGGIVLYSPLQAETDATAIIFTAYKTGCIPASVTIATTASAVAGNVQLAAAQPAVTFSTLTVTGATTLTGGLVVTAAAAFNGGITATTIAASGAVTAASITLSGTLQAATIVSTGTTTLNALTVTNNLLVSGTTTHTGAVTLTGGINAGAVTGTGFSTLTQTQVTGGAYDVTNSSCTVHLAADQAVNLTKINGTSIAGTSTQVAAAFVKFFDVATPTGTVNSLPAAAAGAASGLVLNDNTGADQAVAWLTSNLTLITDGGYKAVWASLSTDKGWGGNAIPVLADGRVPANMTAINGTAITGTSTQIAAAFVKFFNVSSPTGTVNSLPDAVPGAANALPVMAAASGYLSATNLPQAAPGAKSGLPILDSTNGTQITGYSGIPAKIMLGGFLTTAITETSGQIAAAFTKFFDVATPTGTVNLVKADVDTIKTRAVTDVGSGNTVYLGTAAWSTFVAATDEVIATIDEGVFETAVGTAIDAYLTENPITVGEVTLTDAYDSYLFVIDFDRSGNTDLYSVTVYKNGVKLTAEMNGITVTLNVVSRAGVSLISQSMTKVGTTGIYTYDAVTTERVANGVKYDATCSATIDLATRSTGRWVGRPA